MSLTFYTAPNSSANFTVAVLAELEHYLSKTLAKRVEFNLPAGDARNPEYVRTVNPNAQVPAIVHDGVAIWESVAITIYLGETFGVDGDKGKVSLFPPPGTKRGEAIKWIVWTNVTFAAGGHPMVQALTGADKEKADEAKRGLGAKLAILNGALSESDYLLGETYTLADTHVWCFVSYLMIMNVGLDAYPHIQDWARRVGERPALKNLNSDD